MSRTTYNKVTSHDNRAKLAAASKQGPDASRAAVGETDSAVNMLGDEGERA